MRLWRGRGGGKIVDAMVMRFLAAVAVVVAMAHAQAPVAEAPAGSVAGVVRDALTHAALADVPVSAGGSSATTDLHGGFTFERLEPGRQWISVYDERRALHAGVYAVVRAGEETRVEIYVAAGGSIAGKVVDEDGKPVAGASVLLLEKKFEFGQAAYGRELTATTKDNGEYRLEPVFTGRSYLVLAKKPLKVAPRPAESPDAAPARERVLMPAYYPNSADAETAQTVNLEPGENRGGVDIKMAGAESFCIDGKLEVPSGIRPDSVSIREHMALVAGSAFASASIEAKADGKFSACGLHPGNYFLSARSDESSNPPRDDSVSAFDQVTVADRDLRDLALVAGSPVMVSGDAVWDPPPSGKAAETPIGLHLNRRVSVDDEADGVGRPSPISFGFGFGTRVSVPGSFTLARLPAAGDYEFGADMLPESCYIKEASYGTASLLDGLLRATGGRGTARIHVVLACDGGSLTARVTDSDGNPVSNVNLYVMPADAESEAVLSTSLRTAEVEKGWSRAASPLRPGKYLVLASELSLDGTAEPIRKLWRARSKAKEVEIGPNSTVQVTLEVTGTE